MQLPKFKQIAYISPSSFLNWRNCQLHTYLTKLAGFPYKKSEASLAAAIGTAFDIFIKHRIEKDMKLPRNEKISLGNLFENRVPEQFRQEAESVGRQVAKIFITGNHLNTITQSRGDVNVDRELYNHITNIPILGIPDLTIDDVPWDFKTRGFTSVKGAYPRKGWSHRWVYNFETGTIIRREEEPVAIEPLYEPWAIQMLFYNWLLGNRTQDKHYKIFEICKHSNELDIVLHSGVIPEKFSTSILKEMHEMWGDIHDNLYHVSIKEPIPNRRKCERFNTICEAAHVCKFYMNTLAIPERRANYL